MQVLPASQTVPPVQPSPPHCPYLGTSPPGVPVDVDVVVDPPEVVVPVSEPLDVVGVHVGITNDPVGVSGIESSARTHPDLAVRAAGHSTCSNVTVGLSASWNQSKRQ